MTDATLYRPAVFTPEAVAAINQAYAAALDLISSEADFEQLRLKLADKMMFLARNGEVDGTRLCRLAVAAVLGRIPAPPVNGMRSTSSRP